MLAVMAGLEDGVGLEGLAVFDARLELFEVWRELNFDRRVAGGQTEFTQLAGVSAGAKQVDQRRTAFFWISINWPMPARANAMRRAI